MPRPPRASAACSAEAKAECRQQLAPLLEDSGALDYAWQRATLARQAGRPDALDCLADSEAKSVLRILAQYVVRARPPDSRRPAGPREAARSLVRRLDR